MALKFKLTSKDEVPAEMQSLYVERDGSWVLDVDGAVEKAKLDEFRANNLTLIEERDELKQRFDGIDSSGVSWMRIRTGWMIGWRLLERQVKHESGEERFSLPPHSAGAARNRGDGLVPRL